ncbi:MAG: hypothetical protein WD875_01675 [Pirellulales bacterium]
MQTLRLWRPLAFVLGMAFVCGCDSTRQEVENASEAGVDRAAKVGKDDADVDVDSAAAAWRKVDWSLLYFDKQRHLTRLELIFLAPGREFNPAPPLATIACADERVLKSVERALTQYSYTRAPSFPRVWAAGSLPSAEVRLTTDDDKQFSIWIDGVLLLDSSQSSNTNTFYNWTFAQILNELRVKELGKSFTEQDLDRMGGKLELQRQFDEWRPIGK